MTGQRRLGLVAAAATLLAAAPLSAIFAQWTWLIECGVAVGLISGAGALTRTLRAPSWGQLLAMVATLLLALTWMFPSGQEFFAVLPSTDTFGKFGALMAKAAVDARENGVPVQDTEGLLFLAVLGIAAVAILVDLLTVHVRRPALAGLPMLAIYSVPVAVYPDSVPVIPFMIGAVGFMWLLVADNVDRVRRFGRRFTGDGRGVDVWEPSPLSAVGRRLAVVGVAAAVLLPLAVPGLTNGLLSQLTQAGNGFGQGTGGSGVVDLFANLNGTLNQNEVFDMATVTTTEEQPFYLRFGVADQVSQNGFDDRPPQGGRLDRLDRPSTPGGTGVTQQEYRATVKMTKRYGMSLAPTYATITQTQGLGNAWQYDDQTQVLFSSRETARDREFSFNYVRTSYTDQALRSARELTSNDAVVRDFTSVPKEPRVAALVDGLVRDAATPYDKVNAIYRFFSKKNNFKYRLATAPPTDASQIVSFLDNRVGYCQQYAAAMAWMVREAGIPARVAFGFTRGTPTATNTYRLTNLNLHAWTEVYFDRFGWVPFDATPAAELTGSARGSTGWAPDVDAVTPSAPAAGPSASSSAGAAAANSNGPDNRDRGAGINTPASDGSTTGSAISWQPVGAIGGGALLMVLLGLPAVLRLVVRRRRHAATEATPSVAAGAPPDPADPNAPRITVTITDVVRARRDAHAAWDELVDTMIDFQVTVDPTETPRVTAQRLIHEATLNGDAADAATLLGRAEERARYARQPLQGGELTAALTRVRRAVSAGSARGTRLRAALLPPSVTLRWRLAVGDASARLVGIMGRLRERSLRFNPRRLLPTRSR